MAVLSTIVQKTVETSAGRITATTGQRLSRGVRLIPSAGSGKCYWGGSAVTTATGYYIPSGGTEIHPAEVEDIADIYLISDTAAQTVTVDFVGQTVTFS